MNFAQGYFDAELTENTQEIFGVLTVLFLAVTFSVGNLLFQELQVREFVVGIRTLGNTDPRLFCLLGLDDV